MAACARFARNLADRRFVREHVATVPELHPVFEVPYYASAARPWPVADVPNFGFIRLSAAPTELEFGSFIAQVVAYNRLEGADTLAGAVNGIIDAKSLILPGGVQISDGTRVINPSCCCGLEGWREWHAAVASDHSPWMGHEPDAWLEFSDDRVRIWSNGDKKTSFAIAFDRPAFAAAVAGVEGELREFLRAFKLWATAVVGPIATKALVAKIDACFRISQPAAR
jgi:hypothetical protein